MDSDTPHTITEKKMFISHVRQPDMKVQTNEEHQQGVARLTEHFAEKFGMGELGLLMGLLHDKGKGQVEWQKYIQGVTGYNKDYANVKSRPNHSYVGAVIAQKQYPRIAPLILQPILYDYYSKVA